MSSHQHNHHPLHTCANDNEIESLTKELAHILVLAKEYANAGYVSSVKFDQFMLQIIHLQDDLKTDERALILKAKMLFAELINKSLNVYYVLRRERVSGRK